MTSRRPDGGAIHIRRGGNNMEVLKNFWKEEEAIGVVEIILILVILVALVLIFKTKITSVVTNAFKSFDKDSKAILK